MTQTTTTEQPRSRKFVASTELVARGGQVKLSWATNCSEHSIAEWPAESAPDPAQDERANVLRLLAVERHLRVRIDHDTTFVLYAEKGGECERSRAVEAILRFFPPPGPGSGFPPGNEAVGCTATTSRPARGSVRVYSGAIEGAHPVASMANSGVDRGFRRWGDLYMVDFPPPLW